MKYHIAFLTGLMAVLGLFAYFIFSFNENRMFYFHGNKEDLNQVLESFTQSQVPRLNINLSALYGRRGQLQVLHPLLDVRQLKIENVSMLCNRDGDRGVAGPGNVEGVEASCKSHSAGSSEDFLAVNRIKTESLGRFLYEKVELPKNFLVTPPFVNSLGNSYAYLLAKKGPSPYNEKSWIEQHLSYFKIAELKELLTEYKITDPTYALITELSDSEVEMTVRGEPLVLTAKYLMVKDQSRYGFSPLSYLVYDLSVFDGYIKNSDYEIASNSSDNYCLQRVGNACWTYSSKYAVAYLYRYSVVIVVILGLVFISFLGIYFKRLYDKNREQQKHRLSLQVLSHEFRTPVTSMLLMLEQLELNNKKYDLQDQDLVTRLAAETFRLQRIVEVSKTYLQAEGGRIHFKPVEIPSVNHWIADFIAESNLNIQFQTLAADQSIEADPFWLKFILSNLVQNAFMHGAEPVYIRLEGTQRNLKIVVQDQGVCEYSSLNKMTEAFAKSRGSKGMGLGLNIVKHIVDEWGGDIQFSNAPTSFTLSLGKSGMKAT